MSLINDEQMGMCLSLRCFLREHDRQGNRAQPWYYSPINNHRLSPMKGPSLRGVNRCWKLEQLCAPKPACRQVGKPHEAKRSNRSIQGI